MTIGSFYNIIKYCSALSILMPFFLCVLKYKTLNRVLRVLFLYFIVTALAEIIGYTLMVKNLQTYVVQNTFTLFETALILYIYYLKFEAKSMKSIIIIFAAVFFLLAVFLLFIKQGINKQDNVLNTIESAFLMGLAYSYFYNLTNEVNVNKLSDFYFTWINAGVLIYFSGGFVMFLFNEYIEGFFIQQFYLVYCLYLFASIVYHILLTVGIWRIKAN
jgi:hypothetical protein